MERARKNDRLAEEPRALSYLRFALKTRGESANARARSNGSALKAETDSLLERIKQTPLISIN